jgi:hypothetical protein
MGDVLMRGEFLSVVEGDGVHETGVLVDADRPGASPRTVTPQLRSEGPGGDRVLAPQEGFLDSSLIASWEISYGLPTGRKKFP